MNWRLFFRSNSVYFTFYVRIFVILLLLIFGICIAGRYFSATPEVPIEFRHLQSLQHVTSDGSCRVPSLDPWDSSILSYYSKPETLHCKSVQDNIVHYKDGYLEFDHILASNLICSIIPFIHKDGISDSEPMYLPPIPIDFSKGYRIPVEHEFIQVICNTNSILPREVFRMHYAHIIPKNTTNQNVPIENVSDEHPSVIMIGLDSMSRGNFIRQLPKTYSRMKEMSFIDMLGHVKIGDNTYANWLAILAGKRGTSTKEFAAEIDESWGISFDGIDMIWKNFSLNGYATLFAEDRPDIGTFNYFGYLLGFLTTPTDHYFRTYWLASYWSVISRRSTPYCYDAKPKHRIQLDYLQEFIRAYGKKRHFSYWWTQDMSHDFLNVIGQTDDDFDKFLAKNEQYFNDSIVIIFSDHGHRYDKIRETVIGRLEARLPFFSIRIPPSIRTKYPLLVERLKSNSIKMTTQFDVHESLNDIVMGTFVHRDLSNNEEEIKEVEKMTSKQRGFSFFHHTPKNRSCQQAHIPEDYCPCYTESQVPLEEAIKPTQILVDSINNLLSKAVILKTDGSTSDDFECLRLSVSNITFASARLPPSKLIDDPQTGYQVPTGGIQIQYRIVFIAQSPSNAIIEGVVAKNFDTGIWTTTGELERNNRYGNTSHCVSDRTLKKICHCIPKSIKIE